MTDGHGKSVDFRNTVLIMTSNIGSPHLLEGVTDTGEIRDAARDRVMNDLRATFRPEFLNRVDEIVLFSPLTKDEVKQIVELQLRGLRARLTDQLVQLTLEPEALDFVAESAYDPVYGARPVKRFIQRHIETALGRKIIGGEIQEGDQVSVGMENNDLSFRIDRRAEKNAQNNPSAEMHAA